MPSDREMRCWLVLMLVVVWALFAWMLWDLVLQPVPDQAPPAETLARLRRTHTSTLVVGVGVFGFALAMLTRFVVAALSRRS